MNLLTVLARRREPEIMRMSDRERVDYKRRIMSFAWQPPADEPQAEAWDDH